jgi:hypothetical protein
MQASATTHVDEKAQICLRFPSPSRARRRSHHPTTTRVQPSGHAYSSGTAGHNGTAHIPSTHAAATDDPLTARCDLPRPPCVAPRTHVACGAMGHDQGRVRYPLTIAYRLGVTCTQIYAPPSHTVRIPRGYPACTLLDGPSAPASRSRLRARAPQNPPVAIHTTAHAPA